MKRVFPLPRLIQWMLWTGLIFLVVLTLMRVGFYSFFNQQGYTFSAITDALILGLRYDLRVVALILLFMLIIGSIPHLHPFLSRIGKLFWMTVLGIVSLVLVLVYVIDFAHYSYLSQRLNASVLNYLHDFQISLNMVWESYPVIWLLLGIVLCTGIIILLIRHAHSGTRKTKTVHKRAHTVLSSFITFVVLGGIIFGKFGQYPLRWSDAFALGSDYKANLALNPFESFFNTMKFREPPVSSAQLIKYFPVLSRYYPLQLADTISFTRNITPQKNSKEPVNVIVVICESFSAYKSSLFGNPVNTTPFFDSLSKNGILFDRCFTPTYGTARGIWASLTGIPDVVMQSTASRNPAAVDQHIIINDFKGYEKYYFLGGSSSWANIRGLLTNNIERLHLYEQEDFKAPRLDVWGISDKNLLLESAAILGKQTTPFFAIIQTADNHRPYSIPEEDLDEFSRIDLPLDTLQHYGFESVAEMNAFRYTDFSFRKFMEAVRAQPYYDNTLFVFIGDHGIPGNAEALFPPAWTKQRLTAVHVPLLFYGAPVRNAMRTSTIVSQTDLLPTIAGLCGIGYTNTTLGRDVLDSTYKNDFAFIFDPDMKQYGVIQGHHFFRMNMETGRSELVPVSTDSFSLSEAEKNRLKTDMKTLSEAIYFSSKYLLLHNQKKK
jgi:phosphoglycerol transferase MdoB-like AlkP superfamily enzyme